MNYAIHTQHLENYGAHAEDGKFSSGNAYWKMKGGDTYIVSGLDRVQDAVAFVMAAFSDNSLHWKEFPVEWETEEEWLAKLEEDDEEYREFKLECAYRVSPQTGAERKPHIPQRGHLQAGTRCSQGTGQQGILHTRRRAEG
jgi:hypothetical protein